MTGLYDTCSPQKGMHVAKGVVDDAGTFHGEVSCRVVVGVVITSEGPRTYRSQKQRSASLGGGRATSEHL
jgi:hypothetical protein